MTKQVFFLHLFGRLSSQLQQNPIRNPSLTVTDRSVSEKLQPQHSRLECSEGVSDRTLWELWGQSGQEPWVLCEAAGRQFQVSGDGDGTVVGQLASIKVC